MSEEKPTVYLETSFISYLTSRFSRDIMVAAHQRATRDWWELRKEFYHLYISDAVLAEISAGHDEASNNRIKLVSSISILEGSEDILHLAEGIMQKGILPKKAQADAAHIAFAAVNKINYLLTWNCKHIANAEIAKKIAEYLKLHEYEVPYLCTPLELMGE